MPTRLMLAAASSPRSTSIQLGPRLHFNDQPPIVEHPDNLQTSPKGPNSRSEPFPDTRLALLRTHCPRDLRIDRSLGGRRDRSSGARRGSKPTVPIQDLREQLPRHG